MKKDSTIERALGAVPNTEDNRDISIARVQAPVTLPKKYKTDIKKLTRRDQKQKPSCVGQSGAALIEFFNRTETGKDPKSSARALYALCKKRDGYTGGGTYPRVLAKVLTDIGCPTTELVPDNSDLSDADYIKIEETKELLANAYPFRVDTNYAWVPGDIESIKQAIFQNKIILASIEVGKDFGDGHMTPKPPRGRHYILFYGFEDTKDGDTKLLFLNWWSKNWGDNGEGYLYYSENANNIIDIAAFLDIPNAILEEARQTPFIFTQTLKYNSRGTEVLELQKRLRKELANDGKPYFPQETFTTYFGKVTEAALKKYQSEKGIVSSGTPETTGYGQTGPKTRAHLNLEGTLVGKKWIGSPHFTEGRKGKTPEAVVIHIMDGTLLGTDAWFNDPDSGVSAHYGVGKLGEVHQYVKETDQAYHAGVVDKPTWKGYKKGVNPNLVTIGIEHEGGATSVWTEPQKKASAALIREVCGRYGIPIDRDHVIGHYEIRASKPNCPATNKAIISELIKLAKTV